MLNRVVLIGRLTQDPELRYTNSGTAVASFGLAVDRPRPNQAGERETDFINIVVWQKQAELCAQYLHKGRLAAVDGRLQIRTYENRDGQKVRVAEVVAETVRFLDRGDQSASAGQAAPAARPAPAAAPDPRRAPAPRFEDDPFADDSQMIDISDDDLPF
ncbi:single-stranded DNA-binding protein [Alicyclobacillus macrosporangiidus]|uniref:single-stranded DNA-binding protein n=1 Tax=Alicyclobacillus macrosporangiidus TaxID=392015 RepID=UPI000495C477|nr:single-stranded DNA-binding protein [Alicyclobacillus macrosporangiidus]MCL6597718.1 single-stranded DNA-binding protein [Alicyclobacillus macrosporangiidus]